LGKTQIVWKYSNIELLLNIIENANNDIEELMSDIREQNRVLSESMSGSSKESFESSYLKLHSHMIKLRIDLEDLVAKGRDAVRLTEEQDEKIAGKIGKRKG
jgi:hypothetical protein